ncbi:MAG: PAS domain-containing protein [Bacillota bacterium]
MMAAGVSSTGRGGTPLGVLSKPKRVKLVGQCPPQRQASLPHYYLRAIELGQPFMLCYGLLTHSGDYRWISDQGHRLELAGSFRAYAGYCYNITNVRYSQEEFRRERDFSKAVIETANALVVVLDPLGRVVRFNRACSDLTGYSEDEVVGKHLLRQLVPGPEGPMVLEPVRQRPLQRRIPPSTRKSLVNQARPRTLDFLVQHVHCFTNRGTGVRSVHWLDITHQRQMEKQLRTQHERLAIMLSSIGTG